MVNQPILLLVIADANRTGAPTQVYYLARALRDRYNVHCACPSGWLADVLKTVGVTVHLLDNHNLLATLQQLNKLYRKLQPQFIHCHGVRAGIVGRLVADPKKATIIYTEHLWTADFHLSEPWREALQLRLLHAMSGKTACTVAVSQAVADFLIDHQITEASKTRVIYNGIEPIPTVEVVKEPVIGSLAQLTWVKGLETLIEALPAVISEVPDTHCLIAGNGPERAKLENLAKSLQVDQYINWLGRIDKPVKLFKMIQIYVQPSKSESFGIASLEAMSAGIPVVAAAVGAIPEIVNDKQNGRLFKVNEREQLASILVELLKDPKERQRLAAEGQKRALEFNIQHMVHSYEQLYQTVRTSNASINQTINSRG